jgi:hypothetical protein
MGVHNFRAHGSRVETAALTARAHQCRMPTLRSKRLRLAKRRSWIERFAFILERSDRDLALIHFALFEGVHLARD